MSLHKAAPPDRAGDVLALLPQFAEPGEVGEVPRNRIPDTGMPADTAYQIVHDELLLDRNPRLNLASFVTTWMEPQARRLMDESVDKNFIDRDEYPRTTELERRCVRMLAELWHAPGEVGRRGARPPARARRACWAVSRSCGAGASDDAARVGGKADRTS